MFGYLELLLLLSADKKFRNHTHIVYLLWEMSGIFRNFRFLYPYLSMEGYETVAVLKKKYDKRSIDRVIIYARYLLYSHGAKSWARFKKKILCYPTCTINTFKHNFASATYAASIWENGGEKCFKNILSLSVSRVACRHNKMCVEKYKKFYLHIHTSCKL